MHVSLSTFIYIIYLKGQCVLAYKTTYHNIEKQYYLPQRDQTITYHSILLYSSRLFLCVHMDTVIPINQPAISNSHNWQKIFFLNGTNFWVFSKRYRNVKMEMLPYNFFLVGKLLLTCFKQRQQQPKTYNEINIDLHSFNLIPLTTSNLH